jgi:hypothetical protein
LFNTWSSSCSSSIEFDMATNVIFSSLGITWCSNWIELLNCNPIIVKHDATPITTLHGLLQVPLFFSLHQF